MSESLKTTAVYTPKSLSELVSVIAKNPEARIFAGGTELMGSGDFYPNLKGNDIISLSSVSEFYRVLHNDLFIEAGCMVTIQQLLNTGKYIFGKDMTEALSSISSSVLRSQATIGGALMTKEGRYFLSCILSTVHAIAEIKIISRTGQNFKRNKVVSRWVPVSKLYNSDGNLEIKGNVLLTRVRIPSTQKGVRQEFISIGSPLYSPNSTVMFGLQYSISQRNFASPSLCIAFPKNGFFVSTELNNLLTTVSFPISGKQLKAITNNFVELLTQEVPQATELQTERAKRMFEVVLFKVNNTYLDV